MYILRKLAITSLLFAFVCNTAYASAVSELRTKIANIRSMQANFTQVVRNKKRILQRQTGNMAMFKPGLFRWEITKPSSQLLVADGNKLWIYDKDLAQVRVQPQSEGLRGTPALFLSGAEKHISMYYRVKSLDKGGKWERFVLIPRSRRAPFKSVQLLFQGKELRQIWLLDDLGQSSDLRFSDIKMNHRLSMSLFRFTPPKGVDVIGKKTT